ncbi:hypothetical protein [Streptomyces sp. NPDC020489]|uniref:hypothetical protein n=1 Tax=Streptomyces sp. NPDC020489 TaxID=3365077 RepID=UPI0037AE8966
MKSDITPQPPVPELWQVLDDATRECAPTVFPGERIVRRARTMRRRRRLATAVVAVALLVPLAGSLAFQPHRTAPPAVSAATSSAPRPFASPESAQDRSPVRVVRVGERIEAGLGVWYELKKREFCTASPEEAEAGCVGPVDVVQPGTVPMTANQYFRKEGTVSILVYTGKTPAARITVTENGRTAELPIVRLAGRPAYVSTYAVTAPTSGDDPRGMFHGVLFRVYDAHGKELAKLGDHSL